MFPFTLQAYALFYLYLKVKEIILLLCSHLYTYLLSSLESLFRLPSNALYLDVQLHEYQIGVPVV